MSASEELDLQDIVEGALEISYGTSHAAENVAEHIVGAGWRPTVRTVTTTEELDALAWTSVVVDGMGTVALQIGAGLWTMGGHEYSSEELTDDWLTLPATVLYEPEES